MMILCIRGRKLSKPAWPESIWQFLLFPSPMFCLFPITCVSCLPPSFSPLFSPCLFNKMEKVALMFKALGQLLGRLPDALVVDVISVCFLSHPLPVSVTLPLYIVFSLVLVPFFTFWILITLWDVTRNHLLLTSLLKRSANIHTQQRQIWFGVELCTLV